MIQVAIVEDDSASSERLVCWMKRYEQERKGIAFQIRQFKTGLEFLGGYRPQFDIVFMDIEMPLLNGMETARALYEMDKKICIIFITNMAQYAVKGYEVNALDFIIKPVSYTTFIEKLEKALDRVQFRKEREIVIQKENEVVRLPLSGVYYVESVKHYLLYHTSSGEYQERGTIRELEERLRPYGFSRCINGCLVNLSHVRKINANTVWVEKEQLPVSRQRKKEFIDDFMVWLGKGV